MDSGRSAHFDNKAFLEKPTGQGRGRVWYKKKKKTSTPGAFCYIVGCLEASAHQELRSGASWQRAQSTRQCHEVDYTPYQ